MPKQRNGVPYSVWAGMIQRCCNPTNINYHRYGGRGITICPRWRESFEDFADDVGPRTSPAHSIDRYPNNDGNYEPGNVRWATSLEQAANKTRSEILSHDGKTQSVNAWAKELGVPRRYLKGRLGRMPTAEALVVSDYVKQPRPRHTPSVTARLRRKANRLRLCGLSFGAIAEALKISVSTAHKLTSVQPKNATPKSTAAMKRWARQT